MRYTCAIRNMFGDNPSLCSDCKEKTKNVDHLSTQSKEMLLSDYIRRHNEVLKSIDMLLSNKSAIKYSKQETIQWKKLMLTVKLK